MKYSFMNDYSEGCHPSILTALTEGNLAQENGYGLDDFSEKAKNAFKEKSNQLDADVYFVTGGTQANLLCIASILKPFEAILAPITGHIAANEAGAIEATGHKIITVPQKNGKLTVSNIENMLKQFSLHPHMVRVKAVYLSNATELGTVYRKAELTDLFVCCRKHGLYLFMDGARLGAALASKANDMTLADIAELTDVFWLGGTKMGALFGEAIMITHSELKADFGFHLKQRGALLAKGRALGAQFSALFKNDLYLSLSNHANSMAQKLADGFKHAGYETVTPMESNQVFVTIPRVLVEKLSEDYLFYEWEKIDELTSVIRLVTSWATDESQVERFVTQI